MRPRSIPTNVITKYLSLAVVRMINILYVDDETSLLELGKLFLEMSSDLRVETALSAKEALTVIKDAQYDAIISDYQMPVMDGISFLKTLRAEGNNVPFILFTGRGREEVVIEALNSGADFYLQKGGDPTSQFKELEHKVKEAVRRSRAEQALKENEERLRRAQTIGLTGCWEFRLDNEGGHIWASEGAFRLFGIQMPNDGIIYLEQVEERIPERGRVDRALLELIENNSTYDLEYEIVPADGGPHRMVRSVAELARDVNGRPLKVVGIIQDVTKAKHAENALTSSQQMLQRVLDSIPQRVIWKDRILTTSAVTRTLPSQWGYSNPGIWSEKMTMTSSTVIRPKDIERMIVRSWTAACRR